VDLEARPFQHHGHEVLADVVEVALRRPDDDHAEGLAVATRLGDERLEEIEARVHRARRQEHLRHVVLVPPELLAHHVHAWNEAPEDQVFRIHGKPQAFPRLARYRVFVAEDQSPRHDGIVEVVAHAPPWLPPGLTVE
jgi:hypothetical protein